MTKCVNKFEKKKYKNVCYNTPLHQVENNTSTISIRSLNSRSINLHPCLTDMGDNYNCNIRTKKTSGTDKWNNLSNCETNTKFDVYVHLGVLFKKIGMPTSISSVIDLTVDFGIPRNLVIA